MFNDKFFYNHSVVIKNLSYENVNINGGFFRRYIKQMVCKVLPTAINNVSAGTGGMPNIINAAKKHRGEEYAAFSGMFFVDSDVHKVLESMCYAISIDPDGDEDIISAQKYIKDKIEEWIPYYVDAMELSGYFDTYYILDESRIKWSDVDKHELYCMGHFIEAAIAHYRCTGKKDTRLINSAIKCADYLSGMFGYEEGKKKQICGHQEIELALMKLSETVLEMGQEFFEKSRRYTELGAFFLEIRGDYEKRSGECGRREYWQDHKKVEEQTSAVGHAVRAQYMYTAMTELSAIDKNYRQKYHNALTSLWWDVAHTKQYVTGGVGQSSSNEGFLESYNLPNSSAYCETCAGISNMMWNRGMSRLYISGCFADRVENDLYNAVLGSVNLDGDRFYYHNPLKSMSGEQRNKWYGTACCPPNLTRTILSLGGYIYNYGDKEIYINQYISNSAELCLDGGKVKINMISNMPWSGEVTIDVSGHVADCTMYMRKPCWADKVSFKLDGKVCEPVINEWGYIGICLDGSQKIEAIFSMPVLFEETNCKVKENKGYTSIRRGPIVYCAEQTDNPFNISLAYIDKKSHVTVEWVNNLDNMDDPYGIRGMNIIKLNGRCDSISSSFPVAWTFIPFYARMNRDVGHMTVYVAKEKRERRLADFAIPSASYTFRGDSVYHLNDGSLDPNRRWTNWKWGEVLHDTWVQYDFEDEVVLKGCRIWWYDDNGGVRLADTFEIYYKSSTTGGFVPVSHNGEYLCSHADGLISYMFEDVMVKTVRVVINNRAAATGIVEWDVIEGSFAN